ncbi:MAG: 4-phosphopantetheinyl transferase family protein [Bdellovibrionales bacterium]|nr:4-phosphopantetheinyl transferase family protein [Bdellovibrionales bacterium]
MSAALTEFQTLLAEWVAQEANRFSSFEKINIQLSPNMGSSNPEYRTLIRQSLSSQLRQQAAQFDEGTILDLSRPPAVPDYAISISHTEDAGGFLYAKTRSHQRIGFDIESRERVRPAIVKRVLAPGEAFNEGRITQHWCAKEAVVKALAHSTGQLPLITDVRISWLDDSRFVANGAWGFAIEIGDFGFSVAVSE